MKVSESDSRLLNLLYVGVNVPFGKPAILNQFTCTGRNPALVFLDVGDHDGGRYFICVTAPLVNEVVFGFLRIGNFMPMG